LVSHEVVVNLIGSTRTRTGLRLQAAPDTTTYETSSLPTSSIRWSIVFVIAP
jgi:hypothetical protein